MSRKKELLYAARHLLSNIDYLTDQNRKPIDIVNAIRIELGSGAYRDLCKYLDKKDQALAGEE